MSNFDTKRILVVDDNAVNAQIICHILKKAGAAYDLAYDGKQAVEHYLEKPDGAYDIILMDIMMPIMDGVQATREIRHAERSDAQKIPIIAVTSNVYSEDVENYMEAGMNACIEKPVKADGLLDIIRPYL